MEGGVLWHKPSTLQMPWATLPLVLEPQALLLISAVAPNQASFLYFLTQNTGKTDSVVVLLKIFVWCQMKGKGKSFMKIAFPGCEPKGNNELLQPQDNIRTVVFTASLMLKLATPKSAWGITQLYRWSKKNCFFSSDYFCRQSNISFRAAT